MAGIPQNFQSLSPVIANYNFVDIASGTGYINFYAGKTVDLNLLSNFTYYSDILYTEGTAAGSTNDYLSMDIDFDIVLNHPMDVRGKAIVNVALGTTVGTVAGYIKAYLRKVTGGVESDIANNTSSTKGATGTAGQFMYSIDLDAPLTHFKIGDILRLTLMVYTNKGTAGNSVIQIAHDPKNRTSDGTLTWDATGAVPSQLAFLCPVRLNL